MPPLGGENIFGAIYLDEGLTGLPNAVKPPSVATDAVHTRCPSP